MKLHISESFLRVSKLDGYHKKMNRFECCFLGMQICEITLGTKQNKSKKRCKMRHDYYQHQLAETKTPFF